MSAFTGFVLCVGWIRRNPHMLRLKKDEPPPGLPSLLQRSVPAAIVERYFRQLFSGYNFHVLRVTVSGLYELA